MLIARVIASAALFAASLMGPVLAQTDVPPTDSAADRAAIEARAAEDPALGQAWQRVLASASRNATRLENSMNVFQPILGNGAMQLAQGQPLDYRNAERINAARLRADAVGRILVADLDGDWQISREELMITMRNGGRDLGMADLFVLGDTDRNDVLDTEEMRLAALDRSSRRNAGINSMTRSIGARLIDFDDDGVITIEEFERAVAALVN